MNDKDFDKLLKKQMQEDKTIPENINQLFSDFESEVNMKSNKKSNVITFLSKASAVACAVIVLGIGGFTYAHVNGVETIFSPLLRNLGINSKYAENALAFNEEVNKNNVTVKLLDGAIDDTLLILGTKIDVQNITGSWIEINGEYKINDLYVQPINTTIDKMSDTEFVYYQVFDVSEIKIKDKQNVKISINISEIKEYEEIETLDSAYIEYGKCFDDGWSFEETIAIKNLEDAKTYEFVDIKSYKTDDNIEISVTEFITGSYSNILKIKTDKTNYEGNHFDKYYKILDEQRNEIATCTEEERQYDHTVYNDRLVLGNIDRNSKLFIKVYIETDSSDGTKIEKVLEIPVNLAETKEKIEKEYNLKEYKADDYTIKYKENWNLIPKEDRVGPNSIYLGTLALEIPSTTNSEYTSSIHVKVTEENTTIEDFAKTIRKTNTESVSEYFEEKSSSEVQFKNQKGYTIVSEMTDGETMYIKQDIFTVANGKVYRIIFFGSEKEYNNLSEDIAEFIKNFQITNKVTSTKKSEDVKHEVINTIKSEEVKHEVINTIKSEDVKYEISNTIISDATRYEVTDNVKYEISTIKNEYDEEVIAVIKATKDGKTISKKIKMDALIADTDTIELPVIGTVALVAESGGEYYGINIYQLVNGEIRKIGNIDCGADMVKEATYSVEAKDENIAIITASRNGTITKKEFEMSAAIAKTSIIDILELGKVVLVAETGGEYYAFKVYRLSQDYTNGKTTDIIEVGTISYLF